MQKVVVILFLFSVVFSSCKLGQRETLTEQQEKEFVTQGDSISDIMQGVLLKNVATAINHGGTEFAIGFCNMNAIPITDSVSALYHVQIQRLSNKNRNPDNAIRMLDDSLAWQKIKSSSSSFVEQNSSGEVVYYKPIKIGMPTCLKCHGSSADIETKTLALINEKYPDDKAVGYNQDDLRGMWKIKFKE